MHFLSLVPRPEIGANCFLVDFDGTRVLLDAGMHPKEVGMDALPRLDDVPFGTVDGIFLTHAHLDHLGSIPLAQRRNPDAPVYLTEATSRLADIMLHNSVNVMSSQREELGITEYPFFTHHELEDLVQKWQARPLRRPFEVGKGVTAEFFDAGHVLGAVGVKLTSAKGTLFYTSDVNFEDQTVAKAAEFPTEGIDTLVLETTRGDSPRRPGYKREEEATRMAVIIRETLRRGGSVLMPVFALGKTQEMLLLLHELKRDGAIPAAPLFIGGLSLKVTMAYDELADRTHRLWPGFRILEGLPELQFSPRPRRKAKRTPIAYQPGAIYCLSSGMMSENTVSNEFAFDFIHNAKNSLLFVGYADPDSPGGRLRSAPHGYPVRLNEKREPVELHCTVDSFDFSGHSDREAIRDYAVRVNPKRIILVHGDGPALTWFEQTLRADLPACDVRIARAGEKIEL